jgi:quercetin dioxygenase-like cupin family protein
MKVVNASTQPTKVAPAEYFTGSVLQDEVVVGTPPSRLRATAVTFNPGARPAFSRRYAIWRAGSPGSTTAWCS